MTSSSMVTVTMVTGTMVTGTMVTGTMVTRRSLDKWEKEQVFISRFLSILGPVRNVNTCGEGQYKRRNSS